MTKIGRNLLCPCILAASIFLIMENVYAEGATGSSESTLRVELLRKVEREYLLNDNNRSGASVPSSNASKKRVHHFTKFLGSPSSNSAKSNGRLRLTEFRIPNGSLRSKTVRFAHARLRLSVHFVQQFTDVNRLSLRTEVSSPPNFAYGIKLLLLGAIKFHQAVITKQDGPSCKVSPSCSEWGYKKVKRYHIWGVVLTASRLLRCYRCTETGCEL